MNATYNNIEDFESMIEIEELDRLAEIDLSGNPCTEYEDFKDLILNLVPHLEVLNNQVFAEPGSRFKMETEILERLLNKKGEDTSKEDKIKSTKKKIEEMQNTIDKTQLECTSKLKPITELDDGGVPDDVTSVNES